MSLTSKSYWDAGYQHRKQIKYAMVNPTRDYLTFELLQLLAPYLPEATPQHPVSFLEMGCGNSLWLPYFARQFGYDVYGIDYTENGCALARSNLDVIGCDGKIICADFTNQHHEIEEGFDIVFSIGVVEHFKELTSVIGHFTHYLKPGGLMITCIPNMLGGMGKLQKLVGRDIYQVHMPVDSDILVKAHSDHEMRILTAEYLMYMGLGMINLSELPLRIIFGKMVYGFDLIHLSLRHLTHTRLQSPNWSSYICVVAQKK